MKKFVCRGTLILFHLVALQFSYDLQPTQECVAKTLKRLEDRMSGRVSFLANYRFLAILFVLTVRQFSILVSNIGQDLWQFLFLTGTEAAIVSYAFC